MKRGLVRAAISRARALRSLITAPHSRPYSGTDSIRTKRSPDGVDAGLLRSFAGTCDERGKISPHFVA
jgi:hypothetical protein